MDLQHIIERNLLRKSVLSYLLYPISFVFLLIVRFRRRFCKKWLNSYKAPVFIISIGNITAGGSGKTPFTIYLCRLLSDNGLKTGVSHRGYKSKTESNTNIISDYSGLLPASEYAGDEAWLIANSLKGTPVVVGKNRKQSIKQLIASYPDLDCIVLDDSFQHLKVWHDVDFLVVKASIGFGNGFVLPAGYLREPISSIAYADAVIINHALHYQPDTKLLNQIQAYNKTVFTGMHRLDCVFDFAGNTIDLSEIKTDNIVLLSGIGNPESFEITVSEQGITFIKHLTYPDHYAYDDSAVRQHILAEMSLIKAKWLLTTEKDYAKLRKYKDFTNVLLVLRISFLLDKQSNSIIDLLMAKNLIKRKVT